MHTLRIDRKTFKVPGSWEELTPSQRKVACRATLLDRSVNTMAMTLWHLMPSARKWLGRIDGAQLQEVGKLLEWIWEPRTAEGMDDVHPIIPYFWWNGKKWHMPRHSLLDVTLEEWKYVDLYLQDLMEIETQDEAIISLVATICRPYRSWRKRHSIRYDGYPRQPFNVELIEGRIETFRKVPDYIKVSVQDYILRCAQMIRERYSPVFDGGATGGPDFGYSGMEMSIADSGVFGRLDQVQKSNIHEVLLFAMKREMDRRETQSRIEAE